MKETEEAREQREGLIILDGRQPRSYRIDKEDKGQMRNCKLLRVLWDDHVEVVNIERLISLKEVDEAILIKNSMREWYDSMVGEDE